MTIYSNLVVCLHSPYMLLLAGLHGTVMMCDHGGNGWVREQHIYESSNASLSS